MQEFACLHIEVFTNDDNDDDGIQALQRSTRLFYLLLLHYGTLTLGFKSIPSIMRCDIAVPH